MPALPIHERRLEKQVLMSKDSARIAIPFVLVAAIGIAACSDDPASVGAPESLSIQAGNHQTGTPGQSLAQPLEVRVSDGDDQPYAGVTVHWTVMIGDAQVDPPSSTTDTRGIASTTLTLGATPGEVMIEATADGLDAVSFQAIAGAGSDCNTVELGIGTSVDGTLTDEDCQRSTGSASHHYNLSIDEPLSVRLTHAAPSFDAYLEVTDASGTLVAFNDDVSDSDSNSELRAFLAPGEYVVVASGLGPSDLGDYTLSAAIEESTVTDCLFNVWTVPGAEIEQDLASSDCNLSDAAGTVYYADPYLFSMQEGESFTATQVSSDVNPYLELYALTADGFVYIDFNAGNGGNSASMTYTAPVTGVYLLLPSSLGGAETGAYTLTIE